MVAEPQPQEEGATGAIRLALTIPGGENIGSLHYNVTNGTDGGTATGTFVIPSSDESLSLAFEILSLPAGGGYSLVLQTTTDAGLSCQGSSPTTLPVSDASPGFDVSSRSVTIVNLRLTCTVTTDGGISEAGEGSASDP